VKKPCAWKFGGYWLVAVFLAVLPAFGLPAKDADVLLTVKKQGQVLGTYSLAALAAAGSVAMKVEDDAGASSEYIGVPIADLVEPLGIALGKSVSGKRLAEYIVMEAADGYRVLFSLAEIDPLFRDRPIFICYRKNGQPLPAAEGPLRVIVADEKRHARWVRQVTAIDVGSVEDALPVR
jgi:DMSO/TMAO reductase YedYZ molybdopterin-dependent catalytic subunit